MGFIFHSRIAKTTRCADESALPRRIRYMTAGDEVNGRSFRRGKYWTYDSAQALLRIFDFRTPEQLRGGIEKCVKHGLIETGNPEENPLDRRTLADRLRELCRNEQTDLPEQEDIHSQAGKCAYPKGQMIYNETNKVSNKELRENARDTRAAPAREEYRGYGASLSGWLRRRYPGGWRFTGGGAGGLVTTVRQRFGNRPRTLRGAPSPGYACPRAARIGTADADKDSHRRQESFFIFASNG